METRITKVPINKFQQNAKNWFWNEVYIPRCFKCLLWSLLIQWIFLQMAVYLLRLFIFQNETEVKDSVLSINIYSCQNYILLGFLDIIVSVIHIRQHSVKPIQHITRLEYIIYNIHLKKIFHLLFHGILGAFSSSLFLKLLATDYNYLFETCTSESNYICFYNEKHLFVILHGLCIGCLYSFKYFLHWNYVEFPIIQQPKIHIIKPKLFKLFYESLWNSIKLIRWIYPVYYILGTFLKQFISSFSGLRCSEKSSLTTTMELLDLKLFVICWISISLLYLKWRTFICLYQVFITEKYTFCIECNDSDDMKKYIVIGLRCEEFPLFQYLSYIDLSLLANQSYERRREIFGISQPGGHPYHWDAIYTECTTQIKSFLKQLKENSNSGISSVGYSDASSLSPLSNFWIKLKMYFTMELPGLKLRKLYCLPVIFSIKALCRLISASYNEDKYGVVQRSLTEILSLLFALHGTMEKEKIPKQHKDMCEIEHFRQCITNGIYHIVCTFKDHLHSLPLSPEDHKHVDKFLNFME